MGSRRFAVVIKTIEMYSVGMHSFSLIHCNDSGMVYLLTYKMVVSALSGHSTLQFLVWLKIERTLCISIFGPIITKN